MRLGDQIRQMIENEAALGRRPTKLTLRTWPLADELVRDGDLSPPQPGAEANRAGRFDGIPAVVGSVPCDLDYHLLLRPGPRDNATSVGCSMKASAR